MKTVFKTAILGFFLSFFSSQAQLIDYVQGYVGTRIFPVNEDLNPQSALPQNIYAGYGAGQVIGGTLFRQVTDRLCLGAGLELSNTTKKNYNLNITTLNTHAKFNFNNIESFISPYVIGGFDLSFVSLRQAEFTQEANPSQSGIDTQTALIYNVKVTYREPYTNLLFVPVFGAHAGAGLEFKITEGWGLYGQYMFNYSLAKSSSVLQDTYTYNQSNLLYHNFTFGIRFFL
jgi:hypothetical protein